MSKQKLNSGSDSNKIDLYQKMIEEIQDYAIILMNTDGIIQNWNKGAQKIKLYKEEEIIGKNFTLFYLPEDLANNLPQKLLAEAAKNGRAIQEGWRKRKDGTKFWGSITITALHDDDNNVIGFGKVTRDLTEKKIVEDELRMSEERYHQMIAEVQDYAIILLSPQGIIENWNIGAEKIKGYTAKDIIGQSFQVFYTSTDRANNLPAKLLQEAREHGRATNEGWRVRKDGTKFWGSITITALHGKTEEIIGFSKVTRDLTQQKIAEEKIIAYNAELQIQNSELQQFAYVASHDLQEPLRKIQIFSSLIKDNYGDEVFVKNYLDKLSFAARRLSELIKSLLNYSKLATDIDEQESNQKINLNEIVDQVKQDFELMIEEKKASIITDALPNIPGNRMQIGQLFANLISNALKFSPANPQIKIACNILSKLQVQDALQPLLSEKYYQIVFEDNGIGFEQEYAESIFSLFKRLHGKLDYAGTGIGLALCKKITENHNGFITAHSEPGKGAKFNVYLPIVENQD